MKIAVTPHNAFPLPQAWVNHIIMQTPIENR